MQKTVVLVKPDGIQRGLVGEIISRFERKGLKLVGLKLVHLNDETLKKWYEQYKDAEFFPVISRYMSWTPIVAMVWEGHEVIDVVRKIVGTRKGYEAEAGSIRGDFGMSGGHNLIHASDSVTSAEREVKILFTEEEVHDYKTVTEELIYSEDERKGLFR